MNLYHIHAGLAGITFLGVLGLLLPRGRSVQVSALAGMVWLGLFAVTWNEWGWKAGVVAVAMSLLYAAVSLPLAGPVARSLFGMEPEESERGVAPPSEPLRRVSEQIAVEGPGGPTSEVLLDLCLANPAVQMVLARHGLSRVALREQLSMLFNMGAGRWTGEHYLAASALAHPETLGLLLTAAPEAMDEVLGRIAAHLEYGASL